VRLPKGDCHGIGRLSSVMCKVLQAASECNRLKPRACRSDDRGKRGGGVGAEEGVVSQ